MKSSMPDDPDRLFLKCQSSKCGSFEWLDEALDDYYATGISSKSPKPHRNKSFFKCGEPDHWANNFPWDGSPCQEENCIGVLFMKKSFAGEDGYLRLL
ncbi:hypothetical protein LIER_33630 [Lithospermum erythrorhizon]|uniref:Uncharacterized protein n=1 Tax=Lithospermum erythrorhizon TaxID=34254 RepID=A0AAV3S1C2_LITER